MITCQELVEFLGRYLDGELSSPERSGFEEHLKECPACLAYLETYQSASRLAREVCRTESAEIPPEVPEDLVQAVLAAQRAE